MAIGTTELVIALVVILLLFGPKKLPQLARAIGNSIREYRSGLNSGKEKKG